LLEGLQQLAQKHPEKISNARGRGLMCAIDLPTHEQRNLLRDELFNDGLIILACGDQSLRFRPHLNVTKEEIQLALDKIENNINKI
ncbi:aminotransferase class III-fold pyridoxal phosphate-dependent enzyme, partial [Chryseobacterium sp. Alg-005]|uniref:aminotransferase class III-fold pyridoxal phosphate-dependent enzyme n=1 Tax=Chryseobacterium sp. Alg-005 TaxID=3159516 RepID=UPI0036F2CF2B